MTKTLGKLSGLFAMKSLKKSTLRRNQSLRWDRDRGCSLAGSEPRSGANSIFGLCANCVVNDEQPTFGVQSGNLFCQEIEVILEDIGIDSIKNHRAAFAMAGHTAPMTLARIWSPR